MKQYTAALFLILLVGIQACVPTKEIREADTALPATYGNQVSDTLSSASISWTEFFAEPTLNSLIDSALKNNQELNIFLQQVAIARNEIQAKKGEYQPFVSYLGGADLEKVGTYTRNGAVEHALPIKEGTTFPEPLSNYTGQIIARWELDVWKKLRNAKTAAVMEYLSTVEGKNFMITNLVAEIAYAYYELIALDNQLNILNQNLKLQRNALSIVRLQKQAGRATELAVQRFDAEVFKNQSEIFQINQRIVEVENYLRFLIADKSDHIPRTSTSFLNRSIDTLFTGIPSQLLGNRPDIKRAEYELAAAKLNVKIARASFYPSVGLRAGMGLEAFQPMFLMPSPEAFIYSITADLAGPLINRKAIKTAYYNANTRQLAAIYEYEKTILNAYLEVVNGLSNLENLRKNYEYKRKQVNTLTKSIAVSNMLFQSARADYMEVLLTQRDALESKMELVETKKDRLLAQVDLYRALGGGWR